MDIFDRYAPFIQDYIYTHNWQSLRGVQVAAADVIFNSDDHLLLTSSTASGKTEAAFFPILTMMYEDMPKSVGVIYIGPLKALINDQFIRLNELCEEAGIPVWHWHGDVAQSHKTKMLKHPSGILQITPESLEALLMHKHSLIPKLFHDLRFVVIDEVHSLMRGDRGFQTLCLLERLSHLAGAEPRRIGLSATIGDPEEAGRFLSAGTKRITRIPKVAGGGTRWRLSMEHFYKTQVVEKNDNNVIDLRYMTDSGDYQMEGRTDEAPEGADPGIGYIFEHSRGRKCLVFCNSREEAETVTATLRQYCELKHEPDRFLIHHGNLSVSYRQSAEELMKDEETSMSTVTTSTLELGIDIGKLERAFQIDAPFTVSSFLQRMGRTGRREKPQEMWFVIREEQPEPRAMLPETISWKLLQAISLVQLYLEEKWVEPPRLDRLPYSLLYHQTMAMLASNGEMTPAQLASRVLSLSAFHRISQEDYRILLLHLLEIEHLQKTEQGGLILGLEGEKITNNFRFYGVFVDNEEYTVRCEDNELGTIVAPPPVGDKVAIAGRVWVVEEIDHKNHNVYVTMVKGIIPAYFGDCPGDIHTHILERMKRVLEEDTEYPYLLEHAAARLKKERSSAGISRMTEHPLIHLGGKMWALFPWLGTYSFMALERFLKIRCKYRLGLKGMDSFKPYFIQFTMDAEPEDFFEVLLEEAEKGVDPMELVYPKEVPVFEKYDEFVPEELVRKGFAYGVLNTQEMLERVREWSVFAGNRRLNGTMPLKTYGKHSG